MNSKSLFLILLLAIVSFKVQSQELIDTAMYRAVYEFSYKTNPEQSEYEKSDLMYLDIGQKASKFYSRYEQVRDSIGDEGLRKGISPFEISEQRRGSAKGTRPIYYTYQKEGKTTVSSNFLFLFSYYNEIRQMPEWEIGDETKEILGYSCQKAKVNFLGRDWIVYFTPEISINQGPWKLWGLPGLIVEATDENNFFNYTLKAFEELQLAIPIVFVHKTFGGKEYTKNNKAT